MKKLFLFSLVFVLVGAGCLGFGDRTPEVVEGDWTLAFELPEAWHMVRPYEPDRGIKLDASIERQDAEVFLQNTTDTIWYIPREPNAQEREDIEHLRQDDYALIRVLRLDPRRVVPSEATNLDNGFKQLDPCAEAEDCGGSGAPDMMYFFETSQGTYQFNVFLTGIDLEEAESIIFTAKETTDAISASEE